MSKAAPHAVGLAVGSFLGLWHLVWSILVALRLAQPLLDLVFDLHMIQPPYTVKSFSFGMAAGLVVITSLFGYVVGFVLAAIWNTTHKNAK